MVQNESKIGWWNKIPTRYILVLMCYLGICLQFVMKVDLSVAIVAMVKTDSGDGEQKELIKINFDKEDTCPGPASSYNGTTSESNGDFDWDETVQGHVLSAYFYGYVLSQLPGGYVAQKFGGRFVCALGILMSAIFTILSPISARLHLYAFIAARVITGFFSGIVLPAIHCLISKWFHPNERQSIGGIIFAAMNAGGLVGLALSGVLVKAGGWDLVFYFFGGISLMWVIPWVYLTHNSPSTHPRISEEERDYILLGLQQELNKKQVSLPIPWIHILTSPPLWSHILFQASVTWMSYTFLTNIPTYLTYVLHFDVEQSGLISSIPSLVNCFTTPFFGWFSQWLLRKKILSHIAIYKLFNGMSSVGSSGCLIIATLIGCQTYGIVVLIILSSVIRGCIVGNTYMNHLDLAPNFVGATAGILHTVLNITGILVPVVIGILTNNNQTLTQWAKAFYIACGFTVGCFIIYFFFGSVEEQPWNKPKTEKKEVNKQSEELNCI